MMTTQNAKIRGKLLLGVAVAPKEIGQKIAKLRDERGWTQMLFAVQANVSLSTIQRWERGDLPPIRELVRVAELLGVPASELVESVEVSEAEAERFGRLEGRVEGLETKIDRILALLERPEGR